jgi:2-iminobutanoate/2-iminopropanoate deaminase
VEDKIVVTTDRAAGPFGGAPYSQAIVSNGFVFTAGQIGAAADGSGLVGDTVEAQTEQVMANLEAILEAAGSSLGAVVKTTCFLSDLGNFGAFNEVYRKHFGGAFPARSTFGVSLPAGVLVEVEAVARVH